MTALTVLFSVTVILYVAAWGAQAAFLVRGSEGVGRAGALLLAPAALAHVGFLALELADGARLADIHQVLAFGSLLLVLAFLGTAYAYRSRLPRVSVLGAFITPIALLFILMAAFHRGVGTVSDDVRSMVLPVHIVVNLLGETAFALAFAVAIAYVLQERQLKRKKLTGLFQRLPPLDVLDTLGFRLLSVGFPLLSIGVVSGALWAVRIDPGAPPITIAQAFGLLAWLMFGGLLLLRVAAGWRGRRAAIGTMLGFLCTCLLLVGYVIRTGPVVGG
ncbi:MAG: cytochrome c biogenesis protein CcsA [Sandaracinus sp.]